MTKHYSYASLHGGLLARKGQASPMLTPPAIHGIAAEDRDAAARPARSEFERRDIIASPASRLPDQRRSHAVPPLSPHGDMAATGDSSDPASMLSALPKSPTPTPIGRKPGFARPAADDGAPSNDSPADPAGEKVRVLEPRTAPHLALAPEPGDAPEPAEPVGAAAPKPGRKGRKKAPKRYRASVRLNDEQKRRLRIVGAHLDWTNQKVLSTALDAYMEKLSKDDGFGCSCMDKMMPTPPAEKPSAGENA